MGVAELDTIVMTNTYFSLPRRGLMRYPGQNTRAGSLQGQDSAEAEADPERPLVEGLELSAVQRRGVAGRVARPPGVGLETHLEQGV